MHSSSLIPRALLLTCCTCQPVHAHEVSDCLATTGYAFEDWSTLAFVSPEPGSSQSIFLFPRDSDAGLTGRRHLECQPPGRLSNGVIVPNNKQTTSGDGAAITTLLMGTGVSASTNALTTPGRKRATSEVETHLSFAIKVVADDPSASGDVDLTIRTQYDFGAITGGATNGGRFSIGFDTDFNLSYAGPQPFGRTWRGPSGANLNLAGTRSITEIVHSVPANGSEPLIFEIQLEVISDAVGAPSSLNPGDGKAQAAVAVSFEFEVPEGYSVEFPFEAALGLPPPRLGVIAPAPPRTSSVDAAFTAVLPMLLDDD